MTVGSERLLHVTDPKTIEKALKWIESLFAKHQREACLDAGAGWGARAWTLLEYYKSYYSFDMT